MRTERTAGTRVRTVLFDLDGTLADTLPDLAWALNEVVTRAGGTPIEEAALRPSVANGARAMLALALGNTVDEEEADRLFHRFLGLYRDNVARSTRLFAGMEDVLDALERQGRAWGIVTNKLAFVTDPLVDALDLRTRAACVVSGDSAARAKPWPDPLLYAARRARCDPAACVYVGDAAKDIEAARAAGMRSLAALWGYLAPDDDPGAWGADAMMEAPGDVLEWLEANRP